MIDIATDKISNELTDRILQKRIDDLVDARIKEKLGLK